MYFTDLTREKIARRPFPLGKLCIPRAVTCRAADRPPLAMLNRYPGQVIGICFRLPSFVDNTKGTPYLSIIWASPDRWWK